MKKIMQVVFVMVAVFGFATNASAATNEKLLNYAKQTFTIAGEKYTVLDSDLVKIERFLSQVEISDSQADEIIAKADEIIAILNEEGKSDFTELSYAKKQEILNIAKEGAAVIDATLTYDNTNKIVLVSCGTIEVDFSINPYLKQTGSNNIMYAGISGIAILGTATIMYMKKRNA